MALIKAKQIDTSGLTAAAGFTPSQVRTGVPLTVPEFQQWIVYAKPFLVDDDLVLDGDLVLLL
jgi:hypothetical protein